MKLAITLDGTDEGRSGLGTWARGVLPELAARLPGELVAFGRAPDFAAYARELEGVHRVALPDACASPMGSALWHMGFVDELALRCGADVLLLPAANRRASVFGRVRTVAVVHDLAQLHVDAKYDSARMAYARHLLPRALSTATRIVVPSQATARDVERVLHRRPRVVPNGVDLSRFTVAEPDVARLQQLDVSRPFLFYPSRLEHPGKNHVRLVRAFARSRAAQTHALVLAGEDWGGGQLISAELARLAITTRVKLLGRVDDDTLVELFRGADAVVVPGLFEGFGLPALEALSCGRPVCVSSHGALPEVVGPLGVLFDPLDERDMADKLDLVLEDAQVRARAEREGPSWARMHDWRSTADGLLSACEEAMAA